MDKMEEGFCTVQRVGFFPTIDRYTWDFGGVFFDARGRVDNWIQEYLRRWYDFNKYDKGNAEHSHKLGGT